MKKIIFLFAIIGVLAFISGCEEDTRDPLFPDSQAPGPVSSPEVTNLPGAAVITYALPGDQDLLYVKAEYTLADGKKVETKSSAYTNTLLVEGFGDTSEKTVSLYAVDRSENASAPLTVKVNPLKPNVFSVAESIEMLPDFGGVLYRWTNENNASLAFTILATDSTGILSEVETIYSGVTDGEYTVRGFKPVETEFAIIVRDRWDNNSEMSKIVVTPLYEEKLDKSKIDNLQLDNDNDWNAWEGRYNLAFDDNKETFNHTLAGTGWPQYMTIDLGINARLSRVIIVQRQGFPYGHGNPRLLDIWGSKEVPAQDGSLDDWYPLRVAGPPTNNGAVARRPSLQGGTASEDQEHLEKGDEYSFKLDDPEVRYIRLVVNETWGLTGFTHFAEITFYGQEIK